MESSYNRLYVELGLHETQKCRTAGTRVFFGGKLNGLELAFFLAGSGMTSVLHLPLRFSKTAKFLKTTKKQANYCLKYIVQRGKKRERDKGEKVSKQ